ncbi:MAG TPA: beta-ketoacyl synthase N-terminal-like domain-containing protein [Verrucomicrobiales bacterium]|nr:beta-ketoacyl synthase N-terminal-like domain-containing protein [Verrucomicrobiales bacterium]
MSCGRICIAGTGAVTAAGWGVEAFAAALRTGRPLEPQPKRRRGTPRSINTLSVPEPPGSFAWSRHPRLRRASPLTRYAMAAAAEALGPQRIARLRESPFRLGIIMTMLGGGVVYSGRFFGEVLKDPSLASPILFPETVYNAHASHVAAVLESRAPCCTVVGDSAQFLPALEMGLDWMLDGRVDGALVVGGEELDWLSTEAWGLFSDGFAAVGEGAGAVLLEWEASSPAPRIEQITTAETYGPDCPPRLALERVRSALETGQSDPETLLVDSRCGVSRRDAIEDAVWADWSGPRLSPARVVGDTLGAAGALQAVAAAHWIGTGCCARAIVSCAGQSQQAAAAEFAIG